MAETFQHLLHWVQAHPGWAGVVVFLMAFAESLAVVGMAVPGVAVLFTVGALIGAGALNFWSMVAWAVTGAILGDSLSFWLGRHYRRQLADLWPFNRHPEILQRGIGFFQKYGGKSVAIGRFFGPVRAVIPLVAGMMEMPPSRFLFANVLSAMGWAPAYLLPGMAFGASLELASEVALRLVLLLVVLLACLWFLGWISHRLFLWLQPRSARLVRWILSLGEHHPRLSAIAGALGDPDHPEARGLAMLAGLLVLMIAMTAILVLLPGHPPQMADNALRLALDQLRNDSGNHLMLAISAMAGETATLALLFAFWLLLTGFGLKRAARHWLGGTLFIWLLALVLEYLLRTNPNLIPVLPDIFVLRASVFFGLGAVLSSTPLARNRRWLLYSGASVLLTAVVLAQLYFGSSLFAILLAVAVGLGWVTAVGMAFRTHVTRERFQGKHALALGITFSTLMAATLLATPAPPPTPKPMPYFGAFQTTNWWEQAQQKLPRDRATLLGKGHHPFNIHYAGPADALRKALSDLGWQPARDAVGLAWLRLLAPTSAISQLPLVPHSHQGRRALLHFIKPLDEQRRLAIYLWPSGYYLQERRVPVWMGEVTIQGRRQWLSLLIYPYSKEAAPGILEKLAARLSQKGMSTRLISGGGLLQIMATAGAK